MSKHREAADALLRVPLGVIFLCYGVGKFMNGIGGFAAGMEQRFAGKLPSLLVLPFACAVPFMDSDRRTLRMRGLL